MRDRAGCCALCRKPCVYHEAWADADEEWEAKIAPLVEALETYIDEFHLAAREDMATDKRRERLEATARAALAQLQPPFVEGPCGACGGAGCDVCSAVSPVGE